MGYKIMKKKQISLILAVLILGLSGCSSKETSEPIQETIEIESSSEIESSEEESSVIEEPTESSEPETESEEETIEVETTEEITSEIESVEETTEVITEESSNDGVSESEPVQTVESVAEPVQSETPVVEVPVSEPVEIQSQAAEIPAQTQSQPAQTQTQPAQPTAPTQNTNGTITAVTPEGQTVTLRPYKPEKGIYLDETGAARNASGQEVNIVTGEPYVDVFDGFAEVHQTDKEALHKYNFNVN